MKALFLFALLSGCFVLPLSPVLSQQAVAFDFSEITQAVFSLPDSPVLRDADAVFIADVGNTEYVSHSTGKFTVEYTRHCRIKINKRSAFDIATFTVPTYRQFGLKEEITLLEAATYNLENGIVTKTILQKDQVYSVKQSRHKTNQKFAMPGLREGSVVDIQYHISSEYTGDIPFWFFQGEYPRLYTEYNVKIPDLISINILPYTGSHAFSIDTSFTLPFSEADIQHTGLQKKFICRKWVMKNVAGLKEEAFTTSLANYWARVGFYRNYFGAAGIQQGNGIWSTISKSLIENPYFGSLLYEKNNWLNDEMKSLLQNVLSQPERAKKIYDYVRDNFTCTDETALFLEEDDLSKLFKKKQGSVADINLVLVAMLYHAGIEASPVILSTINNGRVEPNSPVIQKFNRTIAVCLVDNKVVYLDAANKYLPYGKLHFNSYNGAARIIRGGSLAVNFNSDSTKEIISSRLSITNDGNGTWKGTFSSEQGLYQGMELRRQIAVKGLDEVIKNIHWNTEGMNISETAIGFINNKDEHLTLSFNIQGLSEENNDLVYIKPVISSLYHNNPLKNTTRLYPVEIPYASDESYDCEITIPKGYVIQDLPETYQILLNGGDGMFEYLVSQKQDKVIVHSRIVFHKTKFEPGLYNELRDFFKDIAMKHDQQIVFKKVKQ